MSTTPAPAPPVLLLDVKELARRLADIERYLANLAGEARP